MLDCELRDHGRMASVGDGPHGRVDGGRCGRAVGQRPQSLLSQQGVVALRKAKQGRVEGAPREPGQRADRQAPRETVARSRERPQSFDIGRSTGCAKQCEVGLERRQRGPVRESVVGCAGPIPEPPPSRAALPGPGVTPALRRAQVEPLGKATGSAGEARRDEDGVDHVDDAVRRQDVGGDDGGTAVEDQLPARRARVRSARPRGT